jgi:hypothetical protein
MRAVVVAGLVALLCPAAAMAQGAPAVPAPNAAPSKGAGITRDRFIERVKERAAARFDKMDVNHDGVLSAEERRAARGTQAKRRASPPQ